MSSEPSPLAVPPTESCDVSNELAFGNLSLRVYASWT